MSTELVQIAKIPPYHQSTSILTACPRFYVEAVIKGRRKPGGLEAARGTQVHRVLAQYAAWCAHKGVAMDLEAFDEHAKGVGPTAGHILAGLRESYSVDFASLLATEVGMSLDENFQPTHVAGPLEGMAEDSGFDPVYQGTLDALYVFREEGKAIVDDAKTHSRPFDPSKPEYALQGKMYSLFVLQFFPWINEVTFRLWFCRYKNLIRPVTYTRDDLRSLMDTVKVARSRQVIIHEDYNSGKEIEAVGNDGCFYCPLLSSEECPILKENANAQGDPPKWVSSSLVYSAYAKANNARMKAWVQAHGKNIVLRDFNQKCYSYGPVEKESSVFPLFRKTDKSIATRCQCGAEYPYVPEDGKCSQCGKGPVRPIMPIVEHIIDDYAYGNPDDTAWMGNLVISATKLNSYLGTKKRVQLDQCCQDSADKVTKATLKLSKPLDSIEDEPEEESEWDDGEEF